MDRKTRDVDFYRDIQRLVFATLEKVVPYNSNELDKLKDKYALDEPFCDTNGCGYVNSIQWHDEEKLRSFLVSALSNEKQCDEYGGADTHPPKTDAIITIYKCNRDTSQNVQSFYSQTKIGQSEYIDWTNNE